MSLDSRIRGNFERIEELPKHEKTIVGYDAFIPPVKYLKTSPPYTGETYPVMQQPTYFNPLYLPHHDMVNPLIFAFLPFVLMAYVKKLSSDIFQR